MFCSNCGKEQQGGAKFCGNCGSSASGSGEETPSSGENTSAIPEDIRKSLASFEKHTEDVQCLKCGYLGPMGLVSKYRPIGFWLFAIPALIVGVLLLPVGGIGILVVGGVIGLMSTAALKFKLSCPNCDEVLETNNKKLV